MTVGKRNIHPKAQVVLAVREVPVFVRETDLGRLWNRIDVRGPRACWLWTGSVSGSGSVQHGQFTVRQDGRQYHLKAHRVVWAEQFGPIPDGMCICHTCDVPRCCNPGHLFLGTQDDNLKDAARKGRFHRPRTRVLTPEDRLAIYSAPDERGLGKRLAAQYGVSKTCISLIRSGRFIGPHRPVLQRGPSVPLEICGEVL